LTLRQVLTLAYFGRQDTKKHRLFKTLYKKGVSIICICYKWERSKKKLYALQWDAKQNDKTMLQKFIEVANTATGTSPGHNGDKFDLALD